VPTIAGNSIRELAPAFLRLGLTAFGGPAAHIAMMEEEFVRRRQWVSHEEFLDMIGASSLIPGPSSTEVAIHIGHRRAGWRGLIVAGVCFILPAMLIVMVFAWAYARFGKIPQVQDAMYGVKPVIIAIVVQALWRLARAAVKNYLLAIIGCIGIAAAMGHVNLVIVLIAAGVAAILGTFAFRDAAAGTLVVIPSGLKMILASTAAPVVSASATPSALFVVFLKLGAVIFGSGYVLLAFLQTDLVDRLHWLTQTQLLDAVAVGQVTPGPVFTTATFIGYLLNGPGGAFAATVGIFLPGFILVAASRPLLPHIRQSRIAGAFLDGVNVGAVALMIMVTWQLGHAAFVDLATASIGVMSAVILIRFRVNSGWLVLAGAATGVIVSQWL
jgi:chromate transporter